MPKTSRRRPTHPQTVAYAHAPARAFVIARAYCTACDWEDVQHCRVPLDIRILGLDDGPRRQDDACVCGGAVWVDVSRG